MSSALESSPARVRTGRRTRGERRHGGSARETDRGGLAEIQRARLIAALVEVAGERGAGDYTVAHVVARSGVSRRTFYELFEDRDACFLAALEEAVRRAACRTLPVFQASGRWRERVRAALSALLEFLDDEPALGRLCLVDALGAGSRALERRAEIVDRLIDAVHEGREEARASTHPTRLTAEGVVGAVLAILHARAPQPRRGPMVELLGPLMGVIVLPYQGQAAAVRELTRPAPRRKPAVRSHADPLRDLDMRLTYRTVRALVAIAVNPGASNRQIADAAGVLDQGQISKLLARLSQLGLIRNGGRGAVRGEPNRWFLTPRGVDVERRIHGVQEPRES